MTGAIQAAQGRGWALAAGPRTGRAPAPDARRGDAAAPAPAGRRAGWGRRTGPAVALVLLASVAVAGCRKARSPEEAFMKLRDAVEAGDAVKVFDALDQQTRWAWMTIQKSHREAYDIVLSNYPEGPERTRELKRFSAGATVGSAGELFAVDSGRAALPGLKPRVQGRPQFTKAPGAGVATAKMPDGSTLTFKLGDDGSWGYADLFADSQDRVNRAVHDLEMARVNGADYERAAARATP